MYGFPGNIVAKYGPHDSKIELPMKTTRFSFGAGGARSAFIFENFLRFAQSVLRRSFSASRRAIRAESCAGVCAAILVVAKTDESQQNNGSERLITERSMSKDFTKILVAALATTVLSLGACTNSAVDAVASDDSSDEALLDGALNATFTSADSPTPILLSLGNHKFQLTNAANGVSFDIDNNGTKEQISWTTASTDDAFLVLDRNANNTVDNGSELFGDFTPQPASTTKNGFLALAEYDKAANGGNADGKIDSHDAVYANLRLWTDANHNGISEPAELATLASKDVLGIELKYHVEGKHDKFGNRFRYRSKVLTAKKSKVAKEAYDVILVVQ